MKSAKEAIKEMYGESNNCVTPNVYSYGWIDEKNMAYELSKGDSFFQNLYLVGVSIVREEEEGKWEKATDISTCFSGNNEGEVLKKAKNYIEELQEEIANSL